MVGRMPLGRWAAPLLLCASACAQAPLGELFASAPGAPAAAQTAGTGMEVLPGSNLSAGMAPATLKLARGGQVRICPRSRMSINSSGQGLVLGTSVGALEFDYRVAQGATDVLFTPDFEIRLGPGAYHFAVGVTNRGDTCFKPLSGNTSGTVFSELMGPEIYGLAPDEAALFPGGKVEGHAALAEACGCPAPAVMRATVDPEPTISTRRSEATSQPHGMPLSEVTKPLPPDQPGQAHLEVETPFVFSVPAPGTVAKLRFSSLPNADFPQEDAEPVVLPASPAPAPVAEVKSEPPPPAPRVKKEGKGFLARLKGFFGGLFHR